MAHGKRLGAVSFENLVMPSGKIINIGLGIDNEGEIVRIISLEEFEELGQFTDKFLSQFKGFNKDSPFEVGSDVKEITGSKDMIQDIASQIKRFYFLTIYAAEQKISLP